MLSLFRTNHPAVYIYLLIYAFLLKGIYFVYPYEVTFYTNALLGKLLQEYLFNLQPPFFVLHFIAILLIYMQALVVNYLLTTFEFVKRQTAVPAMVYITLTSLIPEFTVFSPILVANFFVLFSFDQLFKLQNAQHSSENLFYTAVLISFASLFYWPNIAFAVILLAATLWFKTALWRDFVIVLTGFLLPYYFTAIYFYWTDELHVFTALMSGIIPSQLSTPQLSISHLVMLSYLGFLYLAGYWRIQQGTATQVVNIRQYYQLVQFTLTILLVTFFFIRSDVREERMLYFFLVMFPLTIYFVPLFNKDVPSIFDNLMFYGLILFVIYFQLRHVIFIG